MDNTINFDNATYKDIVIRAGDSRLIPMQFSDATTKLPIDISDYYIHLTGKFKSTDTTSALSFTTEDGDFIAGASTGSVTWWLQGSKTRGKDASYVYDAQFVHKVTSLESTFMYGRMLVVEEISS